FQAEDGIPDRNGTWVQTCALPIYGLSIIVPQISSYGTIFLLWFRKPVLVARSFDYGSASLFSWHGLSIMVPQARSCGTIFRLWFHKLVLMVRSSYYGSLRLLLSYDLSFMFT